MTRFLVLGASGMAGHVLTIYLDEQGHDVTGFSRKGISYAKSIEGDVFNDSLLAQVVREGAYDIVINAIGILNKDAEDNKAQASYLNAYLPHRLAELTEALPTRVFHMSTDCVFAGNTGPYSEDSFPDGRTFYDRTKALGELRDEKNLTFRNSIVGPDVNSAGIGLFNWFMAQQGSISGYTHAMWTGVTTLELAKAMEAASRGEVSGLVNLVPSGSISKFDLLCAFNKRMRGGTVDIRPEDSFVLDKTLVRTDFTLDYQVSNYADMVEELGDWIDAHRAFYPHYFGRTKRA